MAERWDRNRLMYERDRLEEEERARMRGGRPRDHSDDRFDRPRFHDDLIGRDRRYADDEPRLEPRRERDYERRVTLEKDRDREYSRDGSPRRRPTQLRRQSSLDTFDRRPLRRFLDRDEYPPPARREDVYREDLYRDDVYRDEAYRDDAYRDDHRAPAYTPIPLPKSRALAPPRRHYEDAYPLEPDRYADDDFRPYPERVRERELVRERARTHRSSSRSSSTSSHSSRSGGGTTVRNEYPKRGKTRIPARLVSQRALHDLGYRYVQENNTVIVQQALGQENIDELLKLSEGYNKADQEVTLARSTAGTLLEERREEAQYPPPPPTIVSAPPPASRAAPTVVAPPPPPTIVVPPSAPAAPPVAMSRAPYEGPPPPPVEVIDKTRTVVRDVSPARTTTSTTSSWDSHHHHHHHRHHDDLVVGPVIHRSRSRSRSGREIRAEIRALERELAHRPKGELGERDIVRTERLPDGELIVYQERVGCPSACQSIDEGPPPRLLKAMLGTLT
ncbi:hypothetical protein XA68_13273 [Ophiocordyceps unilateralis]|uniref:DUF8035 domain-containing protein n=1 Tax=Ophiocordyceps unilateralis TaxID=268505 RepID=A0A2A9PCY2_OPHUN|nr:hypothetical protein XA68_13273 [Ophiocordyceps unilateralis]